MLVRPCQVKSALDCDVEVHLSTQEARLLQSILYIAVKYGTVSKAKIEVSDELQSKLRTILVQDGI